MSLPPIPFDFGIPQNPYPYPLELDARVKDTTRCYRILYKLLRLWIKCPQKTLVQCIRSLERDHLELTGMKHSEGNIEAKYILSSRDENLEQILDFHLKKEI